MSLIQRFLDKLRRKRSAPVIETTWGPVSEKARLQAETNLRLDPAKRARVLDVIVKECGGNLDAGIAEAKRRYPRGGF